jgi:Galactosyltransferase
MHGSRRRLNLIVKTKTIVLVLSCEATADRREACRSTWMSHVQPVGEILPVFVIGRPGKHPELIGDVLFVDAPDSYQGLPVKVWAAIRESFIRFDFEWIFKTDDDSFVNLYRLRHYPRSSDYMGRRVNPKGNGQGSGCGWSMREVHKRELTTSSKAVRRPNFFRGTWADGSGYFLSRRAASMIAEEPFESAQRALFEDKFVGEVLYSHDVQLHGVHDGFRPWIAGDVESHLMGAVTVHPIPANAMRRVHWRAKNAGEMIT